MLKKNVKIENAVENTPATQSEVINKTVVVAVAQPTEEKKMPGRPIVMGSARQQRIEARQKLIDAGLLKRGRPVVEGCKRQDKLAKRKAKIAAGIELKPGRPKMEKKVEVAAPVAAQATEVVEAI